MRKHLSRAEGQTRRVVQAERVEPAEARRAVSSHVGLCACGEAAHGRVGSGTHRGHHAGASGAELRGWTFSLTNEGCS